MKSLLGDRLKNLREEKSLLQRELSSKLDMDNALYSKIERGERIAKKDVIIKSADILATSRDELLTLWLADQVLEVIKNEETAKKALCYVLDQLENN